MIIDGRYELRACVVDYGDGRPGDVYTDIE